ncbi:MAG: hypothetical protein KDA80_06935 [Planctomycetaceae bacterium]|nr:hypothetical protein [Planctomycetaceae bacterium]
MSFVDFRWSGKRTKASDFGVAISARDHRNQFVADESGVIFVAFDDFPSDQFSRDDLEEMAAHARAGFTEEGRGSLGVGKQLVKGTVRFPKRPQTGQDTAGIRQFVIGEVVGSDSSFVQEFDNFVVKASVAV